MSKREDFAEARTRGTDAKLALAVASKLRAQAGCCSPGTGCGE